MIKQLLCSVKQDIKVVFQGQCFLYIFFWIAVFLAFEKTGIYAALLFLMVSIPFVVRKKFLDITSVWIFLYSLTLAVFGFLQGSIPGGGSDKVFIVISPVPFYLFGKYVVSKAGNIKNLYTFLFITIVCYEFLLYKSVIIDTIDVGLVNSAYIMEETEGRPATHYGTIASLGLSGIVLFLADSWKNKTLKDWILLLCVFLSILSLIHLVRRSGLIIFFFLIILSLLYVARGRKSKKLIWGLLLFVLLSVIGLTLFLNDTDFLQVVDIYTERNDADLAGMGGRTSRWIEALGALFTHPMGWNGNTDFYAQVHNYWLDNARIAGLLPFAFSVLAMLKTLKRSVCLFRFRDNVFAVFLLGVFSIFFLSNLVEPQLDSAPFHVSFMYMICGMINSSYLGKYLAAYSSRNCKSKKKNKMLRTYGKRRNL